MSRKLKRVLHAVEEKDAGVWRVVWCCGDKKEAAQHSEAKAGRRVVTYDRDETSLRPGRCLWIVESRLSWIPWKTHGIYPTLLNARAAMSELKYPQTGLSHQTRLLRFVRRKERGW